MGFGLVISPINLTHPEIGPAIIRVNMITASYKVFRVLHFSIVCFCTSFPGDPASPFPGHFFFIRACYNGDIKIF